MKVGDLVCIERAAVIDGSFQRISIIGIIIELYGFRSPYARVYIIQTPTGRSFTGQRFVGRHQFRKSHMRILNESR